LLWVAMSFVATRDCLLEFEIEPDDTDGSEVSGANSTTPQGGPGAADAASGLLLNRAERTRSASGLLGRPSTSRDMFAD